MPKKKKERTDWAVTRGRLSRWQREQQWSHIITISISSVIAVVLILVSIVVVNSVVDDDGDDNPTVLQVNDRSFDMDYYVKMLRLYGIGNVSDPSEQNSRAQGVLNLLEEQEIIKQLAPTLGLSVTKAEVDAEIEAQFAPPESAEGSSDENSRISYDTFLKRLKRIDVSEKDYREVITSELLMKKVRDYIGEKDVPAQMPQAHIQGILFDVKAEVQQEPVAEEETETEAEAAESPPPIEVNEDPEKVRETIKARLSNGEDFAVLAEEFSEDTTSRNRGGDLGWMPDEFMGLYYGDEFEEIAFNSDLGVLSEPIPVSEWEGNTRYWLIEVLEKEDARLLEEDHREVLVSQAFNDWFREQRDAFTVENLLNSDMQALAIQKALG